MSSPATPTKSNITSGRRSPRRVQAAPSEFTLVGTGNHTPKKPLRIKPSAFKGADRFIPNRTTSSLHEHASRPSSSHGSTILARAAGAFDMGIAGEDDPLQLALEELSLDEKKYHSLSPRSRAYEESLAAACDVTLDKRILAFKPTPPQSLKPIDLRSQYNRPLKPASSAQSRRRILSAPERVLDCPGLADDYYLNLLDWSTANQVAIGLDRSVYVWSADSGSVSSLLECNADTYIASVKWSGDGAYVGVGLGTGEVQIWDVEEGTKLRIMTGHSARVGVMGWNKHILTTGSRDGEMFNHDVRIAKHKVADLVAHSGEVCGLQWRADGCQLAAGANDNLVSIWDARNLQAPKFAKTNHRAAVKALAWCPWQTNLLATGGGANDRHIHFWNTTTGARTNSIDTGSQVTSLRWSTSYKELVSCSGFPDNSLSIWSYPTLVKNTEIPAHESRVLHSALSPDGQTLATAAADESLKFWSVWEKRPGSASIVAERKLSAFQQVTIR